MRSSVQLRELEAQKRELEDEVSVLVQRVKSQDRQIAELQRELDSYKREVSFIKDVATTGVGRDDEDFRRNLIELENKCALLAHENQRLRLMIVCDLSPFDAEQNIRLPLP